MKRSGGLPTDLPSPPTFSKTNPNDQPIMYIALTTDSLYLYLEDFQERVLDRFSFFRSSRAHPSPGASAGPARA